MTKLPFLNHYSRFIFYNRTGIDNNYFLFNVYVMEYFKIPYDYINPKAANVMTVFISQENNLNEFTSRKKLFL